MALERMDVLGWRNVALGVWLDLTTTGLSPADLAGAEADFVLPFRAMADLEAGSIANPDEQRRVGHYWLRTPEIAPDGLAAVIDAAREAARAVASAVHQVSELRTVLVLGIGGSALGPQFVADALAEPDDRMRVVFLDNTDPDGFSRVLGPLDLEETLVVCISKSGGTAETRNALLETQAAYARAEIPFEAHAIAITGEGSALWKAAEGWRARLPMWDWVGGRTSLASAVGLLPMWLQGIDADAFLAGAAAMDEVTRIPHVSRNPAALLALAWHHLGQGRGARDMVMLPYRDRLVLLSRYLQQLVMESLGKEKDLAGRIVHQGLTVYGNKGSTDQHAYVQQLREGPDDYFATFIGVLDDGYHGGVEVDPGLDAGDYLQGFFLGTRKALSEGGHPSLTILLSQLDAYRVGALVALYERAVGLYAFRINVNAYNQPGVEAGKKAAAEVIAFKPRLLAALDDTPATVAVLAERAGVSDQSVAWFLLMRLGANGGVRYFPGAGPWTDRFAAAPE
ncbi:MAG: glucose-6-phosphate isomerase [Pseudomonadota bacterium]|nr:glucose-6-phosphate isomerase [Pseudomonadota bacterium]